MIIGFTGTQRGMTAYQYYAVEELVIKLHPDEVHHGDCIGSDQQFHNIVRNHLSNCKIVIHPPKNPRKRAMCDYDEIREPKDYLKRDWNIAYDSERMIATPAEFNEKQRSGTWATIRYARELHKPLTIFYPEYF